MCGTIDDDVCYQTIKYIEVNDIHLFSNEHIAVIIFKSGLHMKYIQIIYYYIHMNGSGSGYSVLLLMTIDILSEYEMWKYKQKFMQTIWKRVSFVIVNGTNLMFWYEGNLLETIRRRTTQSQKLLRKLSELNWTSFA